MIEVGANLLLYLFFFGAFFVFYWPVFFWGYFFAPDREAAFQAGCHGYTKIFVWLTKALSPRLELSIPDQEKIASLKSSFIICNHISSFDVLLMVSMFKKAASVSNPFYLKMPIFGWILKKAGHTTAELVGEDELWSDRIVADLKKTLDRGGNIFIFPEGTRSRTGRLGRFKKGAFYFAKQLGVPVVMLYITGTDKLFPPGSALLKTRREIKVTVEYLGLLPDPNGETSHTDLRNLAREIYRERESR